MRHESLPPKVQVERDDLEEAPEEEVVRHSKMVDDREEVSAALRREFAEEVGNIEDAEQRARFEEQVQRCKPPCACSPS